MILFRFFNIEGNGHLNLNFKFLKMKLKCHIFKYVKRSKNLFIMSLSLTIQPHQKSRFLEIFSWILNMFAIVSTDFFCCNHQYCLKRSFLCTDQTNKKALSWLNPGGCMYGWGGVVLPKSISSFACTATSRTDVVFSLPRGLKVYIYYCKKN